jgi:hypothetical protein
MPHPVGHRAAVRKRIMPRATSLWEPRCRSTRCAEGWDLRPLRTVTSPRIAAAFRVVGVNVRNLRG